MDLSPFPYQGPLEPGRVRGRDDLVADLTQRLTERRVTALLGPRRFGKTSVLRRVAHDVAEAGVAVVWVDLYEVASTADVAVRFDQALHAVTGRFGDLLGKVAAGLSLNLGLVSVELRTAGPDRADPVLYLHGLLDVLVRAATEAPTILVVDEFSGIARVSGAAGLLRTKLQHHYQEIGLVFAGSEPSMMRTLFTDRAEPFYAQADLVEIAGLDDAEVVATVIDGFAATGRSAGPVAGRIAAFAEGHPQRAMQLADAAWSAVPPGGEADQGTWEEVLARVRADEADASERLFSNLQDGEKLVLRVLASGGSIFGTSGRLLGLANGRAQHARRTLIDKGHVVEGGGRYRVVDPVLADWVRNRFPL